MKILNTILVGLASAGLSLPPQAIAGGCRGRTVEAVVVQHHVQQLVAQPVVAVQQKIVAVETPAEYISSYAVPVFQPESYYRVAPDYRDRNVMEAIVQEILRKQQLQAPAKVEAGCNCQKTEPAPCPPTAPQPEAPKAPEAPAAPEASQLEKDVLAVFTDTSNGRQSCVSCHNPDNKKGGLSLVNKTSDGLFTLSDLTEAKKEKVYIKAERGLMPPSVLADPENPNMAHAVSNEGVEKLFQWANQ